MTETAGTLQLVFVCNPSSNLNLNLGIVFIFLPPSIIFFLLSLFFSLFTHNSLSCLLARLVFRCFLDGHLTLFTCDTNKLFSFA